MQRQAIVSKGACSMCWLLHLRSSFYLWLQLQTHFSQVYLIGACIEHIRYLRCIVCVSLIVMESTQACKTLRAGNDFIKVISKRSLVIRLFSECGDTNLPETESDLKLENLQG
eukprot:TRINITY_DN98907_c0_g1_i1.p1 TRINITY_DN98907_c0_g1~~TRINITY_DN98907_c0_g1_i1.p1  ORF type:complete len:113 (-),score=9.05 TRINITY_DN98907_c0_g1_i1:80-418(-)